MRLTVRVHPRASHARVEWDGSVARVWVTQPAVDGLANRALVRALADWCGVPPSSVRLISGSRSRTKIIEVQGVEAAPAGGCRRRRISLVEVDAAPSASFSTLSEAQRV